MISQTSRLLCVPISTDHFSKLWYVKHKQQFKLKSNQFTLLVETWKLNLNSPLRCFLKATSGLWEGEENRPFDPLFLSGFVTFLPSPHPHLGWEVVRGQGAQVANLLWLLPSPWRAGFELEASKFPCIPQSYSAWSLSPTLCCYS